MRLLGHLLALAVPPAPATKTSAMNTFPAYKITLLQCTALMLLSLVCLGVTGKVSAYSFLLGGLVSVIPNLYFAYKVFSHTGARAMEKVVRNAYQGELVKLLLIGAGFALVFAMVRPLKVPEVFAGFILIHLSGIAGLVKLQR